MNREEEEIWKCLGLVVGGGEKYEVSTLGNVRNKLTGKVLKPVVNNSGYGRVTIRYRGVSKLHYVHRLVALSFLPKDSERGQVNHISGVKTDNSLRNLEWVTASENIKHSFAIGLSGNAIKKPVDQFNLTGVLINSYSSIQEASRQTGVSAMTICFQCKRENSPRFSHYYFRYAQEKTE